MVINKLKSALLLAVVVAATCSWNHIDMNSEAISSRSLDSAIRNNQKNGYEVPKIIRKGVPSQLLERLSYKTSYNKETRTPNWVGWALTSEHIDGEYARKGHSFIEDLDVPLPRAIPADIRESECGYQRGHMCPAGDNKWSYKAKKDAFLMLKGLSGKEHKVFTGVCIVTNEKTVTFSEESTVKFESLTETQILEYIKTGEPMDKAGSYGIQGKASAFAKITEGSFYNVMGLPIETLNKKMLEFEKIY